MARFLKRVLKTFIFIGILGGIGWTVLNHQMVYDLIRLRSYKPSKEIQALADHTTMSSAMRRVFYVNHPVLADKTDFSQHCPTEEQTVVLGCYISNQGIYLFNVTEPTLAGVQEVTAAHEALHAEYDRLGKKDKEHINNLVTDFFENNLKDDRIKENIEAYRKQDPSVVPNELHSILATEVRDLTPELEKYYSRYFANRKQIVTYSEQYEQVFTDLKNQVNAIDAQLDSMKQAIDSNRAQLDQQNVDINVAQAQLDSLLASHQTGAYNSKVPAFNQKVSAYNSLVKVTKDLINQYNELINKRNNLAVKENELYKSVDSRIDTKPQQ